MLKKKVAGAAHLKDRLKNRLHHAHSTAGNGSRHRSHSSHGSGGAYKQTSMSFSSVDNEAFEQILDDDTDFVTVRKAPPTRSSGRPANTSVEGQHSDLFNADMFDDQLVQDDDKDSPGATPASVPSHYDPLSGQIVTQSVVSSNSSDGESGGMEIGNETEPWPGEDGMGNDRNGTDSDFMATNSTDIPRQEQASKLEETKAKLEEIKAENAGTKALDTDYLFDEEPGDTQELPPSITESLADSSSHNPADELSHSVEETEPTGPISLDVPQSCESPVSSLPSSVENDPYWQEGSVQKVEVPARHQVHGSNHSGSTATSRQREMRPSSMSDLEAELEQLLAPRPDHSPRVGASRGSTGVVHHELAATSHQGPSLDGERAHLDSGVYEPELNSTPDGEKTGTPVTNDKEDGLFPIYDDHFTRPQNKSVSMPTPNDRPSSKPSNQSKKNSAGKTPPPRPPISPRVQKRMMTSAAVQSQVTEDRVAVKLVRPLGRVPLAQQVEEGGGAKDQEVKVLEVKGEEGREVKEEMHDVRGEEDDERGIKGEEEPLQDQDELFPDDRKKMRAMDELAAPKGHSGPSPLAVDQIQDTTTLKNTETPGIQQVSEESDFDLAIEFHLLLSLLLYLYYSLNIFPYLSGLFAGFLMLYMFLGSVFIYYVQTIEKEREERQQERKETVQVSDDFVQTMKVDFSKLNEYHSTRFTATLR